MPWHTTQNGDRTLARAALVTALVAPITALVVYLVSVAMGVTPQNALTNAVSVLDSGATQEAATKVAEPTSQAIGN